MRFYLFIIVMVFLSSCYYDSEEYLYPASSECDTMDVTYNNFVAGLMDANCNSCHNPTSPSGNIVTSDYDNLLLIVNNGKLEGAVNHLPGYSSMPKGSNKLPDCDLDKLNAWLNAGNPEN